MTFTKTFVAMAGAAALAACSSNSGETNNMDEANMSAMEPSPMAVDANMMGTDMNAGMGADMNAGMSGDMNAGMGAGGMTANGSTGTTGTTGTTGNTTTTGNSSGTTGTTGTAGGAGNSTTPSNTL